MSYESIRVTCFSSFVTNHLPNDEPRAEKGNQIITCLLTALDFGRHLFDLLFAFFLEKGYNKARNKEGI